MLVWSSRILDRRLVHFGQAGLGIKTRDASRKWPWIRDPHGMIHRVHNNAVATAAEPNVHPGRHRQFRVAVVGVRALDDLRRRLGHPWPGLTVAVRVDDQWAPALCSSRITRLVEHTRVDPPNRIANAAQVQRVVVVLVELQVVLCRNMYR